MVAAHPRRVNSSGEGSLGKGLAILQALAQAQAPRGISELARDLGLPKSAVHRLLRLLMEGGWVRQDAAWRYGPTLKIWELGTRVGEHIDLRKVAAPVMQSLLAATRETVYLSVREGFEVLVIDKLDSADAVVSHAKLASRSPAHASASGKALLAWMDERALAELPARLQRFTPRTHRSRSALLAELRTIRHKGFAVNRGEWHADIGGVASPVHDASGSVIASLGIHMLASHLTAHRIRECGSIVAAHARRLTHDLGGSKPLPQEKSS